MKLNDIDLKHGAQFSCECRVRKPVRKTAITGTQYLSFTIEDSSMSIKANVWSENYNSTVNIRELDKVVVSGKIKEFNGDWLANISSIQHLTVVPENPLQLITRSMCPSPHLLEQLHNIIDRISHDALRNFIFWVFSDDYFAIPFINVPASRKHHHNYAGGLLEHSLECAEMVSRFSEFGQDCCDLAIVGALLHDAGKTVTLKNVDKFSPASYALDHDALTLEVLAPYLKRLDAVNSDLAVALRYIWTWKNHKRGNIHPILTIVEAISVADKISSALSIKAETFKGAPDWQRFSRYEVGKSSFWRPRFDKSNLSVPLLVSRK